MTFTVKVRGAGGPMLAEYCCPVHGRFEAMVERNEIGDPPMEAECQCSDPDDDERSCIGPDTCGQPSPHVISAPKIARDSVPCYAAVKGGDTERRHHQLIAKGLKTKRVQV